MSENDFFARLRANPNPVVVDFWAPWCGPCKMIDPILKSLGKEYDGRVEVLKINVDEQPGISQKLRIYGIPTVIGFKDGQEVLRHTGSAHPAALAEVFEAALQGERPERRVVPLTLLDRFLRLAIGAALLLMAYLGGFSSIFLVIAGLGGIVLFSAVYDRCPVWRALIMQIKTLLHPGVTRS